MAQLLDGDLVLFPAKIAKFLGMKYQHVGLVSLDGDGNPWIFEAVWPRVRWRELWLEEQVVFARVLAVSDEQRELAADAALQSWRKKEWYGVLGATRGIMSWVMRKYVLRAEALPLAVCCSEAVAGWWQAAGATLCMGLRYPMPDDLATSPRIEVLNGA